MSLPQNIERLLYGGAISNYYFKGPEPVPALTIAYAGVGTATVQVTEDAQFVVAGIDGAPSFTVPLDGVSFDALVAIIVGETGFSATLAADGPGAVWALSLLAAPEVALDAPVVFQRATNPLYLLFLAVGRQIDLREPGLDAGPAQLNLLRAAGYFADFWAEFTDTPRLFNEIDDVYVARQLHELIRGRENNYALADLIEEDDPGSKVVDVQDLEPFIFRCSATPMREYVLAGEHYNAASFEVILDAFTALDLVVSLVERNRAAGTTGYVIASLVFSDIASGFSIGDVPLRVGPLTAMKIGPGTIGVDKIGPP